VRIRLWKTENTKLPAICLITSDEIRGKYLMKESQLLQGPHQGQPIRIAGEPISRARGAMLMLHGRGASAEDILSLANEFDQPGFAYLAPQAAGNTWYPNRFLVPLAENEPWLSSGLAFIADVLAEIINAGIPREKIILLGFSQGACLIVEFAARNAQHYGGVVGLSGALIGPEGTPRDYPGSLAGTPVFLIMPG
jgi:predicted esterase